jgi:hypothetical protein
MPISRPRRIISGCHGGTAVLLLLACYVASWIEQHSQQAEFVALTR